MNRLILFISILSCFSLQPTTKYISGELVDIIRNPAELVLTISLDKSKNKAATLVIPNDTIHAKKIISYISIGDSVSHEIGSGILYISKPQSKRHTPVRFEIKIPSHREENKPRLK